MDLQKLNILVAQQVTMLGFELVYMETAHNGHDSVIRLYVDYMDDDLAEERLLTIEDCTIVSNALVAWMDTEFPSLREDFIIEISSPGLERPLVKFEHFRRFCGRACRIRTKVPINGQKCFNGYIREVTDKTVSLEEDGKIKVIPLDMIHKAHLTPFNEKKGIPHHTKTKVAGMDKS